MVNRASQAQSVTPAGPANKQKHQPLVTLWSAGSCSTNPIRRIQFAISVIHKCFVEGQRPLRFDPIYSQDAGTGILRVAEAVAASRLA
ncbi:MAG: hypothetical protein JST40_04885 [Armatimonadetes bacterium]|nr:hypothetical protein [Armatimonadota bacterium]